MKQKEDMGLQSRIGCGSPEADGRLENDPGRKKETQELIPTC